MKKRLFYLTIGIIAVLLVGCGEKPEGADVDGGGAMQTVTIKEPSFYANMYGANLYTQLGEEYYALDQQEDGSAALLYRAGTDGDFAAIAENIQRYFLTDDYIYYVGTDDDNKAGGIYRVDHNGSNEMKISEQICTELVAAGDKIYFVNHGLRQDGILYCADLDGGNIQPIKGVECVFNLFPYGDKLYFCVDAGNTMISYTDKIETVDMGFGWQGVPKGFDEGKLYCCTLGDEAATIARLGEADYISRFIIVDDTIYYISVPLCAMNLDGSNQRLCPEELLTPEKYSLNYCGGKLLIGNILTNSTNAYDIQNGNLETLLAHNSANIWVQDNTMLCYDTATGDTDSAEIVPAAEK